MMVRLEQNLVGAENVAMGKRLLPRKFRQSLIKAGHKRVVLKAADDVGISCLGDGAQIAASRQVAKGIEGQGLVSRS